MKTLLAFFFLLDLLSSAEDGKSLEAQRELLLRVQETSMPFPVEFKDSLVDAERREFDQALRDLAAAIDPKLEELCWAREGNGRDYKLACIALHFAQNRELYAELQEYLRIPDPLPGEFSILGTTFPELKLAHKAEKYRLAWEYLMIVPARSIVEVPSKAEPGFMHKGTWREFRIERVLPALQAIRSEKSAALYEFCFVSSVRFIGAPGALGASASDDRGRQELLNGIATHISIESARRIMTCLEAIQHQPMLYATVRQHALGIFLGISAGRIDAFFRVGVNKKTPAIAEWRHRRILWRTALGRLREEELSPEFTALRKQALEYPEY